jgi:hypothetical protein
MCCSAAARRRRLIHPRRSDPLAKGIYTQYQNADCIGLKRVDPKQVGFTVDTPVPYRLQDLVSLIDERMGKLENRSSRIIYHKLISRVDTVKNDPRYAFCSTMRMSAATPCRGDQLSVPPAANGRPMTVMQPPASPWKSWTPSFPYSPHGVRFQAQDTASRRCCSFARKRIATRPPTATSASDRPARRSRASPRKAANTASSRAGHPASG